MDLHNKAVSIQQSADLSSTNELENKFATHLSQFSEGSVIHLPRLEHALKTLPFKLDDKKTRKKLEEIIQELDDFTKVSIQSFVTYKSTVFLETNSYFSESVIPERSLVLIGDSSIIWTHNVFRFIKKLNHKYLEVDVLSNIEQYRTEENFYSPKKVRSLIFARLEDYETTRLLPYYNEIMEYSSNQKNFKDIDMKKMTRCLALTNQYIKGYVLYNIITMAIQKYISVFTDPEQTPYLELSVHYRDGSIEIQPSLEKIKQYHSSVLKKIASLCSSWEYLGKPLAEAKKKRLNIKHQDDFLVAQETIMLQNLDKLLSPLLQKFKIQEADLSEISKTFFEEKNSNVKTNSSSVDNKFWMTWQDKIEAMNDVDFIGIFRLFQQPLKTTLLALVKLQTTQALCDLIYKHLDLNLMIRKEANAVKDRCRKIPCCSEELVAVSKYMQTCSTQWIQGLKLRTIHLLKLTTELMNVVELTNDHTNLVCGTISLLNSIKASFREFKQMFDATKGEIEEDLRITTEELNRDLEEFGNNYLEAFNYFDKKNHLLEYVQYCSKYLRSIEKFDARVAWINKEESLLNIVLSTYPELDEIKMIVFPLTKLIIIVYKWLRTYSCYMDGPFEPATFEGIERVVDENSRLINGMNISFKAKIRQHILDNYPKRFKGFLDDPDFNAWPSPMKIAHFGLEALSHIKNQFVLIEMLANPHLRYRHWEELSSIVGFDLMPNKGSSLRQFISYKLEGYYDKIQIISTAASREAVLQQNFESMQLEWVDVNFETTYIKELFVLGSTDDIREILDRHMNDTVTMRGSAFVKPIKDPIDSWHEFLLRTNSILDKWCDVQEQWLSFLDIFSVPAIYAIMGQESVTFKCVDQDYRSLLDRIKDSPQVINVCEDVTTLPTLNNCLYRLEVIRVGVNAYIQNVRLRFPRMFFLPNRESLYILSQTSDPQNVEPYLTQCFEGIKHICLNERNEIESVINSEGEKLDFTTSVSTRNAQGIVEKWLIKVETVMFESIKHELKKNIPHVLSLHNDDWLLSVSGQVVMCINQILWTAEVQTALKKTMSRDLAISLNSHKERLNLLIESIKKLLPKQKRMTVSSLIIQELHNITVVESLIKNNCVSVEEFLWVGQLRYYWSANDVIVEMLYTTISYGYEYIGNISHLVETPLTDRCFRSILSAYHLHLHGALIGPSGVGKTETFKNLSKHLAIKCIVHSCSSGIGLSAIEMFLRGAAACGAWVCFKRLDSVENSIISVVNQHLLALGQAVMSGFGIFDMNGLALKLKSSCMISVTLMSGTSNLKLPKELKAMFRTIPLVVPEYSLIIEATLYSVGVSSCKPLATKLVTAMKMYEELLILKPHRLGLRTILSIVTIMDDLKQKNLHHCEMGLLCSAVKRIILPQLTNKDIIDFDSITKALFPYTELNFSYDERVAKIIKEAYIERNLLCDDKCLSEMMVLYETLMNNQGVIVIGPPFAGKTQFLQILNDVVLPHSRESSMEVIVINPNIISNNQLYGMLDERSSKWTDGLISRSIRSLSTSSATSTNLLVFDGPISESWADGLNTLLDDNKKLCLGSGEIISFHSNSLVVFEVDNIDLASPALVSRCGLVNFDLMKTAWKSLVRLWMDHIPVEWRDKGVGEKLELLLGWLLPPCLHFINKFCQKIVDDGPYHNVHNCLKMTEFQLTSAYSASIDSTPNGTWTSAALILGLLWGLGGALDCASKQKFDIFFKNLFTGALEEYPVPETYDPADMTLPMDSSLYDYGYLFRVKGGWKYLSDIVKTMKLDDDQDFSNMIIPTIETFKYLPIVKHCIKENIPVILCGPTSTGKTFYIHHVMSQDLSPENYSLTTLTLTGKMTSSYLQEIVLSRLIKQRKGVYSSPVGKKSVVFMDDLALPSLGGNHQPVHELIRQYCDYSYWFDADNLSKITMKNIYFFGTIGSGRGFDKSISPRLLRHFFLLAVSSFSDETISRIFSNSLLIGLRKNGFPVDIHTTVNAIVAATSFLYNSVMDNLRPTPSNCHYVYSLKDFSKILQGIMLARKESADNKRAFIRLWVHETLRVFGDRIHKTIDRCWLFECLGRTIEEVYKDNISNVLDNLGPEDEEVQCESLRNLVFTSGIVGDVPDERKYEEASIDDYHRFISKTLEEYNSNHETKLNIIVFRYVLEHVARLCRVFIMPGASIILIGIGGTGRQSFIKLATAVGGETLIKIEGSSHYGVQEWRSDIKKVMKMSGGQDRETVFVFNEFKTNEEFYYQDIDALLVSGEIPNLFVNDDLQDILEDASHISTRTQRNDHHLPLLKMI